MDLLFSPGGRIGRLKWWLGQLLLAVVMIFVLFPAFSVLGVNLLAESEQAEIAVTAGSAGLAATLVLFILSPMCIWINFCIGAKRYHDRNKPAVWFLMVFVPIIGPIWQIVECGFLSGTAGGNNYGPYPSAGSGWSSKTDQEIAATWQEKHEPYQHDEEAPAAKRPVPAPARTAVPTGFGRRGLQT